MPILGLVLTLEDAREETRDGVAAALRRFRDVDPGEPVRHRWPVVLEAGSEAGAEARVDALRALCGVAGVDVVYADFEDLLARPSESGAGEDL